jgi:CRP-like cAMP-binding protein
MTMVEKDDLKKIAFLNDLDDETLAKIGSIAQLETFDEETTLFRQNQEQNLLYMLLSGHVFLNSRSAKGKSLTLDDVTPGRTFGVSAILGESSSTFTAVCSETSAVITISGDQMRELFKEDFAMGATIMEKVVEVFRARMNMHTGQLLHSLSIHPGIRTKTHPSATLL